MGRAKVAASQAGHRPRITSSRLASGEGGGLVSSGPERGLRHPERLSARGRRQRAGSHPWQADEDTGGAGGPGICLARRLPSLVAGPALGLVGSLSRRSPVRHLSLLVVVPLALREAARCSPCGWGGRVTRCPCQLQRKAISIGVSAIFMCPAKRPGEAAAARSFLLFPALSAPCCTEVPSQGRTFPPTPPPFASAVRSSSRWSVFCWRSDNAPTGSHAFKPSPQCSHQSSTP